jgi:hypothetical protein
VHEYPVVDGVDPVDLVGLDIEFPHDGYAPAVLPAKRKAERNLALLERAREQDPDNPRWPYFIFRNPLSVLGDVDLAELCDAIGALADRGVRGAGEYHRRALAVACQGLALRGDWRTVDRYCAALDHADEGESPDAHYFRLLFELLHGVVTERDLRSTVRLRKDEDQVPKSTACPDGRHLDALVVALLQRCRGAESAQQYLGVCEPWSDVFFERSRLRLTP